MKYLLITLTVTIHSLIGGSAHAQSAEEKKLDFFESKIRPVLVEHCYRCHSVQAGKSKGGLLLDSRTGWEVGGDSGPAIVPFKPQKSLVHLAINHSGESSEMPPDGRLSEAVVRDFESWIKDGAIDPRAGDGPVAGEQIDMEAGRAFWSFQPRRTSFQQDNIDDFIAPQAPPATANELVRRLFLDLIGLPPTPEDQVEFATLYEETSPSKAVEVFTERLLLREEFGEKWARHWMDVARYADSNGGDFNLTFPESWRYRNYLIDAFNNDMPYDQFIREQIAGDLLPAKGPTDRNRKMIATGFLMVAPKMLTERNKPKMHLDIADEQVDTIGRAILGLTLGCARCHDHKFDPIPTTDYYAMLGILHSTRTADGILMGNVNVSGWKETELAMDAETQQLIRRVEKRTEQVKNTLKEKEQQYEKITVANSVITDDSEAITTGNWRKSTFRPNHIGSHYLVADKDTNKNLTIQWRTRLPAPGRYEVRVSFGGGSGLEKKAPYVITHAEGETRLLIDQTTSPPINGIWYPLGTFTFTGSGKAQAADKDPTEGIHAQVTLSNQNTTGPVIADAIQFLPAAKAQRSDTDGKAESLLSEIEKLKSEIGELKAQRPQTAKAMVATDHTGPRLGDVHLRIRGETNNLGPLIPRGFLQIASVSDASKARIPVKKSGRIELAKWLTTPENPLTARVMANRIWQHLFGRGIVSTTDNFGIRGTAPTHPELLDFLATNFVDAGWSMKSLIRRIVQSKTYQQSSKRVSSSDPENRFLRRQNCRAASAEVMRDSILAIAGELDRERRESSVKSLGMYAIETSGKRHPSLSQTGDLRQRSIYMPVIRGAVPPSLAIFDLPNPDLVTGTRSETTVPTQALFMLNSDFIRDMSQAMSARVCSDHDEAAPLIQSLYQRILIRSADADDLASAEDYITNLTSRGKSRQDAVASFVQILFSSTEFRFID